MLRHLTSQYLVPITATNKVVPLLIGDRHVLYIGDYELRGPADQIEANTRRRIERHTGRVFDAATWERVALTQEQVESDPRLQSLVIEKIDRRYKPPKPYQAVECEALGQVILQDLLRARLDALLPEPLADVLERERDQQRHERAALNRSRARGRR